MANNSSTTTKLFTVEQMFGENSREAQQLIDAAKEATMLAQSMGEVRRLNRMLKAKLRMLRSLEFMADNT